ncbi:hypothetical protein, partial [Blautia wexlerae]|uniref:hypothetical protein n=1 Tax=Blautia wexlerae TaxID=418240 RepID=UPI0034A2BDED
MTSSDGSELEARAAALRRIVYGTPDGYAGPAAAELEAVEVELGRRDSSPREPEPPSPSPSAVSGAGLRRDDHRGLDQDPADARVAGGLALMEQVDAVATTAEGPDPHEPRRDARRRALIVCAVAAAVAAVASIGPLRELTDPPRGLAIFDRAPDPSQALIPGADDILTAESLASVRYIGTEVGYRAWVFRDRDDVCMTLQRENWAGAGTTCVAEAEFERTGIREVVRYEQLYDLVRPVGVGPGDGVEFAWTAESTGLEWSMRR